VTYRTPMSAPEISEEDIGLVVEVLRSGTLSLGPYLDRFESAFAGYIGARYAVAVSSGTAALHLCLLASGIGPGDEVITSPFSFVSSANCILHAGAAPVFADIDEDSLNLDPVRAAEAVTDKTRAILPIHVFGQPADMTAIMALAADRGLTVIEDACEAIGAEHRGVKVGRFGKAGVFSFYANKQMTTGEGAVITTEDAAFATLLRSLRNQGRDEGGAWLSHPRLGYNYRMTEMSAALGVSQISRIEAILARRAAVAKRYREELAGVEGAALISPVEGTTRLSWFAAAIRLADGIHRDRVIAALDAAGVPSRAYFSPLHLEPVYRARGYGPGDFPVTERVAASTLALPFHSNMADSDIALVCEALARALRRS